MDTKQSVFLYAGIGAGLYFLYRYLSQNCPGQTSGMCSVYNSLFASGSAPPSGGGASPSPPSGGGTPPPSPPAGSTSGTTPLLPPAPTTPAVPVVQITGTVTPDINNSLKASVTINGQPFTLAVIPSAGTVYDNKGQEVSAQLTALNVNIPSLIAQFQRAYVPTASGVDPTAATGLRNTLASLQIQFNNAVDPTIKATLQSAIAQTQAQMTALGISGINDYPDLDLAYPYVFGKSSLGAMGDDRFAHSRIPASIIHQGPRYAVRRR